MKKIIPNAITSANLFCGCLAITQIAEGNFTIASLLVLLGAFFDFFDGLAARALKVGSPLGAQLDSLADMVTFGLVPAYLAFELLNNLDYSILNCSAFLIAIFSAVRLAKFNIDDRQSTSFIGVPTPANALFWIGIPHLNLSISIMTLLFIVALSTFLLNSRIKFIKIGIKKSFLSLSFIATLIIASLILGLRMGLGAISGVVVLYVVFSTIQTVIIRFRN